MDNKQVLMNTAECLLFVAGDPVPYTEMARVLGLSTDDAKALLFAMEMLYREQGRGVQVLATGETVQLISNRDYAAAVETLIQPNQTQSVSQTLLETLAIIAYRQPVTRADIERIRGVRCEYAISQLQKLGLIVSLGQKDAVGKPTLFGTTDRFLRQFGIHAVEEMPNFPRYSAELLEEETEELTV